LDNPPVNEKERPLYQVFNIGNGSPVSLMEFIKTLEENLGKVAEKNMLPMQAGDVPRTWADTTRLNAYRYQNTTSIKEGVRKFTNWYKSYINFKNNNI